MKMKYRFAAILLTFAIFSSCAPSTDVSTEPSPSVELSSEPTAAVEMNYFRYTGKSSFYPLWAQPNSEFTVTKTQYSTDRKFTVGGYLEREDIDGREDIAAVGLYSTAAEYFATPNSKALYDENGRLSEILYLYSDGNYRKEPPSEDEKPVTSNPGVPTTAVTQRSYSEDDINLSYDEYFSTTRQVCGSEQYLAAGMLDDFTAGVDLEKAKENGWDSYRQALEDKKVVSRFADNWYIESSENVWYTDGNTIYVCNLHSDEVTTLYTSEDARIISVGGNEVVMFFMTDDYKIYRLHIPSGMVDFICDTAYDFEKGLEDLSYYSYTDGWEGFRDYRHYYKYQWVEGAEIEYDEEWANDDASFEEWIKRDHSKMLENDQSFSKKYMPTNGYFEVLSNKDVRYVVVGEWLPTMFDMEHPYWFSKTIPATGTLYAGEYVTYSAALGKYGARWEVLDTIGIPDEMRMTFTEFCGSYGRIPPYPYA